MAYELSGAIADPHKKSLTYNDLKEPIRQFMAAEGGLANGRLAIDYVLQQVQTVNRDQLFACGHSSAADIALNLARGDARIRGCCATRRSPTCRPGGEVNGWTNSYPDTPLSPPIAPRCGTSMSSDARSTFSMPTTIRWSP